MALTEPAQFTTEKKKQDYLPIVFVDCTALSKYWCTNAIGTLNGHDYEAVVKNISSVSCRIDRKGGLATVGNITVDITNFEDYSAWLASTPDVENNVCEFYLIFDDGTALVFNEAVKFFTGLIEDLEIDHNTLSVSISHQDLFINDYVGELVPEDTYDFQYESSVGRFKPIIYGDHRYNGTKPNSEFDPDESPKVVPCIQLSPNRYMISCHTLGYFNTSNLWLYNRNLNRFFWVDDTDNQIAISNPDGNGDCTFTIEPNKALVVWDCWLPTSVVQSTYGSAAEFSDEDNIIDRSISTYGHLSDTFGAGAVTNLDLGFPSYDFSGYAEIYQVQFYSRRDWSAGGVAYWKVKEPGYTSRKALVINAVWTDSDPDYVTITTGQTVNFQIVEAAHNFVAGEVVTIGEVYEGYTSLSGVSRTILSVPDATHFTIYHPTDQTWTAGNFTGCQVGSANETSIASTTYGYPVYSGDAYLNTKESIKGGVSITANGTGTVDAKLYIFFKRIKMAVFPSDDNILCASCKGYQSGGNDIENPVTILKHVCVNHGGLIDGDFDSTSFTAAETARASWVFNPVFMEYKKTKYWINELAEKCNIYVFWNNENKLKMVPYIQGASAAYTSNVLTISESPAVSSYSFTKSPAKKNSLKMGKTDIDGLINKLNVPFSHNYATNKIYQRIVCENTTSHATWGICEEIIELPYTTDDTTAGFFAENIIDMFSHRMFEINGLSARLSSWNIELGDIVAVENFINDGIKWLVTSVAHDPMSGQGWIIIDCVEQRDLSGDTVNTTVETYIGNDVARYSVPGGFSGYTGGSGATGETVSFRGTLNMALRGIVFFDQFGQPVYEWRENAGGSRLERKTSYTRP